MASFRNCLRHENADGQKRKMFGRDLQYPGRFEPNNKRSPCYLNQQKERDAESFDLLNVLNKNNPIQNDKKYRKRQLREQLQSIMESSSSSTSDSSSSSSSAEMKSKDQTPSNQNLKTFSELYKKCLRAPKPRHRRHKKSRNASNRRDTSINNSTLINSSPSAAQRHQESSRSSPPAPFSALFTQPVQPNSLVGRESHNMGESTLSTSLPASDLSSSFQATQDECMRKMLNFGFSNINGRISNLIKDKNGDIDAVLGSIGLCRKLNA